VTLTVEGPPKMPTPQAPFALAGDTRWQLVKRSDPIREAVAPSRERWRLTYQFAPAEPGKVLFAFPPVKYRLSDENEHTATWDAVEFEIARPGAGGLRDDTSIESLPPLPERLPIFWIALCIAGLLSLAGGVAWGLWRWWRHTMPRTSAQLALDALDRLLAKNLPESGRSDRFVTLLTMIVRRYLERHYAIPARRRTTPEFAQMLDGCQAMTIDDKHFLAQFFSQCDAVKFAQCTLKPDECRQLAESARQFIARSSNVPS
jgi:hypothetical protein